MERADLVAEEEEEFSGLTPFFFDRKIEIMHQYSIERHSN
jgi:hypothetical protein